jgi:hypothetical protein
VSGCSEVTARHWPISLVPDGPPWYTPGMSDDRKKPLWPWIAAVLVALPVLYVGSYALLVERSRWQITRDGSGRVPIYSSTIPKVGRVPFSKEWDELFAPIHALDRKLRPGYWPQKIRPE